MQWRAKTLNPIAQAEKQEQLKQLLNSNIAATIYSRSTRHIEETENVVEHINLIISAPHATTIWLKTLFNI